MTRAALPFVAPFFLFMVFVALEGYAPDQHYLFYPVKTLAVGAVILWFWRSLPDLKPSAPLFSGLVGVVGVMLWIGLDPYLVHYDLPLIGRNPFQLYTLAEAWVLFSFRVLGIALCVPIMEELFWRGFLMRWLIQDDFTRIPLGTYRPVSFFLTTSLFASVHGTEWSLAVIVGLLYGWWFVQTKSLGNIMTAHGVTNLLLICYCLFRNDWHFLSIVAPPHK